MGKKLKNIGLVLFSICCTIGFSTGVSALTLEEDMKASDITIEDGMTIDGQGKYKIIGQLNIKNGESVTIKNVTFDGENGSTLHMLYLTNAGDIVVDNVNFVGYEKAGIYGIFMSSLTVSNSMFDANNTSGLVDEEFPGHGEEEQMKRSAAGIDLNLGNNEFGQGVVPTLSVKSITISNNTFKNVVVEEENQADSTAGAIKIKLKNSDYLAEGVSGINNIRIEENIFENNFQDLVIGTDTPAGATNSRTNTGNLDILLINNDAMIVTNNSDVEEPTETLDGNYKLNYTDNKKYELDDNLYYIVDEDNIDAFTDEEMAAVLADTDVAGIAVTYQGVSFAISKETLLDEDLGASLDDFDIVPSEETTIEALKQYMGEDVMFYTVSGIDLLDDGMSVDISDLGEEFVGTLYLYYYDETNGLQLVSNPNNASLTFDKNGTYVLSATNLIPSTPSEETPSEEVPEVPQTFDALGVYVGIGLVSLAGIAGAVIYLKRRNA